MSLTFPPHEKKKTFSFFQEDADDEDDDEDIDEDFIDDIDDGFDDDDEDEDEEDEEEEDDDEADGGWCRSSLSMSSFHHLDLDLDDRDDLPPVLARDPNAPRPCSSVLVSGVDALLEGGNGIRPEDQGPVDGTYELSGCLHGRGLYLRRASAEEEGKEHPAAVDPSHSHTSPPPPPRVLWFSRTFNDWDLALRAAPRRRRARYPSVRARAASSERTGWQWARA